MILNCWYDGSVESRVANTYYCLISAGHFPQIILDVLDYCADSGQHNRASNDYLPHACYHCLAERLPIIKFHGCGVSWNAILHQKSVWYYYQNSLSLSLSLGFSFFSPAETKYVTVQCVTHLVSAGEKKWMWHIWSELFPYTNHIFRDVSVLVQDAQVENTDAHARTHGYACTHTHTHKHAHTTCTHTHTHAHDTYSITHTQQTIANTHPCSHSLSLALIHSPTPQRLAADPRRTSGGNLVPPSLVVSESRRSQHVKSNPKLILCVLCAYDCNRFSSTWRPVM